MEKNRSGKLYLDRNLQLIFGITLMAVMGVSSITPVFPKIIKELNLSTHSIGMLITMFTLPGVILTPFLGILADRYGRKRIIVPSLMLFGIAGGACAFTRDFNLLLVFRFFQGVGAASLSSLNATLVGDLYPGKERTTAMGYNASVLSIGTAGYPALGGALAMLGWFYPFLLPVVAIPLGFLVLFSLKNPEPKGKQPMGRQFISAIKAMVNRQVIGIFIASVITFLILYGPYLTYFPILMGDSFNASPFEIGVIFTAMSLVTAIASSQIGKLSKKYQEQSLMSFAFLLYAMAIFMMPWIPGLWFLLIPSLIYGIGHGINIPCIMSVLAGSAPMEHRATFMSLNGMVLRLGQTLGPMLMGIVFSQMGMNATFYAGAILGILMFLLGLVMFRKPSSRFREGPEEPQSREISHY